MPIEVRRIEFTDIELKNALSLYHSKTVGGKAVSNVRATGGDDFAVVAKVTDEEGDTVNKVFDHDMMVVAMVLYSKEHFIPLPRAGRKIMSITDYGTVAMSVRYVYDVCREEREALMPMKSQ